MKRLGVIGFGDFSEFFIPYLKPFFDEVLVYSRRDVSSKCSIIGVKQASFEEVSSCEFVFVGVVVQYFEETLKKVIPHLQKGACVFEACSVKEYPIEIMKKHLPEDVDIIATHPLFGPNSGRNGIVGLNVLLINVRARQEIFDFFDSMFKDLKLTMHYNSAKEHDEDMAYVQALSHFIAQGIREFGFLKKNTLITTKAYESLLQVEDNLSRDSWLLFESIENYNKYAKDIRSKFIESLQIIDEELRK